jgi:Xaa-Pro dipeptidase
MGSDFLAWSVGEFQEKVARIRQLVIQKERKAVLITLQNNFFWLTGGRPYINSVVEKACGEILVTEKAVYLIVNNIEADRLCKEEIMGLPIEKVTYNWWEPKRAQEKIRECAGQGEFITDVSLGLTFSRIRWDLTMNEQKRFQDTGSCVGKILGEIACRIEPGNTELEIADMIKSRACEHGVNANVALVAVDDRTFLYRHPLPTAKRLEKYAMLVISGEKHGLYASATRLVHFGKISAELGKRYNAVLQVDAAYITTTNPGSGINDVFQNGIEAYAAVGFDGEWIHHHQGGMAGYNSREIKADMFTAEVVNIGQAYAWNPTIAGVKSEDTFIVGEHGPQIITNSPNFPVVEVEYKGFFCIRPDILIR